MPYVICIRCDHEFYVSALLSIGNDVHCPSCHVQPIVRDDNPIKLDWIDDDNDDSSCDGDDGS